MGTLTAISLFSGCGGFDFGAAQAGVEFLWANDIDPVAGSAYRSIFPNVDFHHVTNWIGQQFHSLGEKEDQSGVKGVFVGSTSAVSSGADGASKLRHSLRQTGAQGDDLSEHNFRS